MPPESQVLEATLCAERTEMWILEAVGAGRKMFGCAMEHKLFGMFGLASIFLDLQLFIGISLSIRKVQSA